MLGTALSNTPAQAPDLLTLTDPAASAADVAQARRNVERAIDEFLTLLTDTDPRFGPLLIVLGDGQIRAVIDATGSVAAEH